MVTNMRRSIGNILGAIFRKGPRLGNEEKPSNPDIGNNAPWSLPVTEHPAFGMYRNRDDIEDVREARKALLQGGSSISWKEAKKNLGKSRIISLSRR